MFDIAGSDGTVNRVYPPTTARGTGDGSTLGDVQAAYPAAVVSGVTVATAPAVRGEEVCF